MHSSLPIFIFSLSYHSLLFIFLQITPKTTFSALCIYKIVQINRAKTSQFSV
nr:MAG TPA: hypothetical protein [Bacteriophage sp.]